MTKPPRRKAPTNLGLPKQQPNLLSPPAPGNTPSARWGRVSAEDIGEGLTPIEDSEYERLFGPDFSLDTRPFRNKFVEGSSKFVTYTVRPRLKKTKTPESKPVNQHTRVDKATRKKFGVALTNNIEALRSMFVHDLLPVTLSINSVSQDVQEMMSQIIDDSVSIPVEYISTKALQAVQLRIIRSLCEVFKLNKEEAKLMTAEFLPRLQKADNGKV